MTELGRVRLAALACVLVVALVACGSDGGTNRATAGNDGLVDVETDTLAWEDIAPESRRTFCGGYHAVSLSEFRQIVAERFVASDVEVIVRLAQENC